MHQSESTFYRYIYTSYMQFDMTLNMLFLYQTIYSKLTLKTQKHLRKEVDALHLSHPDHRTNPPNPVDTNMKCTSHT